MAKISLLTTVYNRSPSMLLATFKCLANNWNVPDIELIIVDDNSDETYRKERDFLDRSGVKHTWLRVDTIADNPHTYNIDGYNNPAYAWNRGLEKASGERIIMLSSDCLLPKGALQKASNPQYPLWVCKVINYGKEKVTFLDKDNFRPLGWFTAWDREKIGDISWDQEYLKGIAYEDNDFSARLALASGEIFLDNDVIVLHQEHLQIAYSDNLSGHKINREYTTAKWGGIPWHDDIINTHNFRIAISKNA